MEAKETQVDEFNPVFLRNTIADLRNGLSELVDCNDHLNAGIQQRYHGLEDSKGKLQRLFNNLSELLHSLGELQTKCELNQRQMTFIDRECEQLETEKENLHHEEKFISTEENYQCLENKVSQTEVDITLSDKEAEKNLRDFTRDDLYQKMDELNNLKKRLVDKREETANEWDAFKEDVEKYREEKRPYLQDLDKLNQQTIKRLTSIAKYTSSGLNQSERNAIYDTVKSLELDMEYRTEMNKLQDCQIRTQDLENEISGLLKQHDALWKQNAELEAQIQEFSVILHGQQEAGILLKRSAKHDNLPERDLDEEDLEESPSENVMERMEADRMQHFGKILHKCSKHTDIQFDHLMEPEIERMESLWVSTHYTTHVEEIKNQDMGPEVLPEAPSEDQDFPEPEVDQPEPPPPPEEDLEPPEEDQDDDNGPPEPEDRPDGPPDEPDDDGGDEEDDADEDGDDGPSNDEETRLQDQLRLKFHGATEASNFSQEKQLSMVSKLRTRLHGGGSSSTRLPKIHLPGGIAASGVNANPLARQSSFRASPMDSGRKKRR